jgi:hypothetical protein
MSGDGPSAELRARVLAAARAEAAPVRSEGARHRAIGVAIGFALAVFVSVALGGPALSDRQARHTALLGAAWMLVAIAATWIGVSRGRSMLGRPPAWRLLVATLTPAALLGSALAAGLSWPSTLSDDSNLTNHVICMALTPLFAFGPLVGFAFARRASDPIAPELSGAAIGAAAGAWGSLAIELHCSHTSLFHVAVGHVLPVVAMTLAGAAVGSRIVALRARTR